jgi:2-polyprenyl-6-methoxyphenol hydroxylase-like FAD-dependent oxidoreductase
MGPNAFAGCLATSSSRVSWFVEERADIPETAPLTNSTTASVHGRTRSPPCLPPPKARYAPIASTFDDRLGRGGEAGIVLLGDAAHSLSPSLGQGAAQAFTDAAALAQAVLHSLTADHVASRYKRLRARRAMLTWLAAEANMNPHVVGLYDLAGRLMSDRMTTLAWIPYTRPDPAVRRQLQRIR